MMTIGRSRRLVGGLEPWNFRTFHILGTLIPTDELIFFREVETTNQYNMYIHIQYNMYI
jgi:hypothetical protein